MKYAVKGATETELPECAHAELVAMTASNGINNAAQLGRKLNRPDMGYRATRREATDHASGVALTCGYRRSNFSRAPAHPPA